MWYRRNRFMYILHLSVKVILPIPLIKIMSFSNKFSSKTEPDNVDWLHARHYTEMGKKREAFK